MNELKSIICLYSASLWLSHRHCASTPAPGCQDWQ